MVWGYNVDNYHHNTLFLFMFWACFALIAFGVLWARIGLFERTGLPVKKRTSEEHGEKDKRNKKFRWFWKIWCFGKRRNYELL